MGWFNRNGKWYDLDKFVFIRVKSVTGGNGGCCGGSSHMIVGCLENMEELQIGEIFSSACEAQEALDCAMEDQF